MNKRYLRSLGNLPGKHPHGKRRNYKAICKQCGEEFQRDNYQKKKQDFCSLKCRGKFQETLIDEKLMMELFYGECNMNRSAVARKMGLSKYVITNRINQILQEGE